MIVKRRAVILAGGFGTRIRHLLPGIPKPMAPVAGKPFLEWIIRFLARQKVREVMISTGYLEKVVSEFFGQLRLQDTELSCVAETGAQGTGGGFLNAVSNRALTGDPWLVCNGDSLALADLNTMYSALEDPTVHAVILGKYLEDTSRYGSLLFDERNQLEGFRQNLPGVGWINAGVYLFREELIRDFPAQRPLSLETDVFPLLLDQAKDLRVSPTDCPFLDIGTEETLSQAEDFILSNREAFL